MTWRRIAAIVAALAGIGVAGWAGLAWFRSGDTPPPAPQEMATAAPTSLDDQDSGAGGVETVDISGDAQHPDAGTTPMAQRVAVLGLLNKRNGQARDVTMKPGEAQRIGGVIVRLRACEQTAPWEPDHYTGAFVQLDVLQPDRKWRRVHSGWLYKERPGLNVVLDPVYDVWVKSCAMTFPGGGPETGAAPAGAPSPEKRSSAEKSPAPAASPTASPSDPSIAAPSNAT